MFESSNLLDLMFVLLLVVWLRVFYVVLRGSSCLRKGLVNSFIRLICAEYVCVNFQWNQVAVFAYCVFSVKDSSFNFIDTVKLILQKAVILIFGWLDMLVFIVCYWIRHVPKHCLIMCSSLEDLNYLLPENVLFSIDPFTFIAGYLLHKLELECRWKHFV